MFPLEKCIDEQLRQVVGSVPTIVFPEAEDPRIIQAASELIHHAKIIMMAAKEEVVRVMDDEGIALKVGRERFLQSVVFVRPEDEPDLCEKFAAELAAKSKGRSWEVGLDEAAKLVLKPVYFAILAVRLGYADAVLGGVRHSSRDFFQPCLRLLERDGTVYEMALFALPDSHTKGFFKENLVMFADIALNPEPDPERLADIAVGACKTMRDLVPTSVLPEVNCALLSYSTRGSGAGASVDRVRKAEPIISERLKKMSAENPLYESIHVAAELQIGCAISKQAARTKLKDEADKNPAMGGANVLIAPNLDTGNLLYHIYDTRHPDALPVLVIGGLRNQALDFSRGSQVDDIVTGAKALILRMYRSGRFTHTPDDRFFPRYKILTINPGRTYTELALWDGRDLHAREKVAHPPEVTSLEPLEQLDARKRAIDGFLAASGRDAGSLEAVVGRGGLLAPLVSGTYRVGEAMIDDLRAETNGSHVVNLGAMLARSVGGESNDNVWVIDPAVVDELDETSRVMGLAGRGRKATWHALSQKSVAKRYSVQHAKEYDAMNLIVGHLGSGVSVGAHRRGRCVQVNNALYEGPMSLTRAGAVPTDEIVDMCFSGLSKQEALKALTMEGGLKSLLGITDFTQLEHLIEGGDAKAELVFSAFAEQVAAQVASLVPKFGGASVDQIILTGELTDCRRLVRDLRESLGALGIGITVYSGDLETEALRDGALRVLRGVEHVMDYEPGGASAR